MTTRETQHLPALSSLYHQSSEFQSPGSIDKKTIIIDYVYESFPSIEDIEDKNDPRIKNTLGWKLKHPDSRGKHDKAHRAARKHRLESVSNSLIHSVSCSYCGATGTNTLLFTDCGTCTRCGTVDPEYIPFLANDIIAYDHIMLTNAVRYDPRFYIKERLNNWRGICPSTPNEHMREIVSAILSEIGRPCGFSARAVSRSLIYTVINRLYGSSAKRSPEEWKSSRKCLVYRERWLSIKHWICSNHAVFEIPDAVEWLRRFDAFLPTDDLIDRIERMMRVLEHSFNDLLYASKRDGIKRHNRPRRDVSILFLLYGLHPGLIAIYGTDYWKPPTTKKSRDENTTRFRILLDSARKRDPLNHWPDPSVSLESIMSLELAEYNSDLCSDDINALFPCDFPSQVICRSECMLY